MSTSTTTQTVGASSPSADELHVGGWAGALVGAVVLGAAGHLLIKSGVNSASCLASHAHEHLFALIRMPLLFGILLYLTGTTLWVFAVAHKEISFLYPITALTYVIVAVGGKLMFHESVSALHWLGIVVVVSGIALMQRSDDRSSS